MQVPSSFHFQRPGKSQPSRVTAADEEEEEDYANQEEYFEEYGEGSGAKVSGKKSFGGGRCAL